MLQERAYATLFEAPVYTRFQNHIRATLPISFVGFVLQSFAPKDISHFFDLYTVNFHPNRYDFHCSIANGLGQRRLGHNFAEKSYWFLVFR